MKTYRVFFENRDVEIKADSVWVGQGTEGYTRVEFLVAEEPIRTRVIAVFFDSLGYMEVRS